VVTSRIDAVNRPVNTGSFGVRVPPSPPELAAFFVRWRKALAEARKWRTAARDYTMARLAGEVGLRAAELCGLALDDLHFDYGPLGKIHVRLGKGSRGSGPRERLVPMLGDARALLVWWVSEVRGEYPDDWELPRAVLFPSERDGPADAEAFRLALKQAAGRHLQGPVRVLTPHVLRHACASRLYEDGLGLVAIQQLLGHRWLTTTSAREPSGIAAGGRETAGRQVAVGSESAVGSSDGSHLTRADSCRARLMQDLFVGRASRFVGALQAP
jgi:integrase